MSKMAAGGTKRLKMVDEVNESFHEDDLQSNKIPRVRKRPRIPVKARKIGGGGDSHLCPARNSSTNRDIKNPKLYEEVLKENQTLKSQLSRAAEVIAELKLKLDKLSTTPRITSDDTEKMEKRALERKLSEMEEELKEIRTENQKLRDENGALNQLSKLSK